MIDKQTRILSAIERASQSVKKVMDTTEAGMERTVQIMAILKFMQTEIMLIISAPIPRPGREGVVHPAGPAIIGEGGPEIVHSFDFNKDTNTVVNKIEIGYPNQPKPWSKGNIAYMDGKIHETEFLPGTTHRVHGDVIDWKAEMARRPLLTFDGPITYLDLETGQEIPQVSNDEFVKRVKDFLDGKSEGETSEPNV